MIKLPDWLSRKTEPTTTQEGDSLDAFHSEQMGRWAALEAEEQRRRIRVDPRLPIAAVILISIGLGAYLILRWRPLTAEAASASLTIESDPKGATVLTGGLRRGLTPLTVQVTPGEYAFELEYQGLRKTLRTVARPGAAVVHHVQFDGAPAPAPTTASLSVVTDPPRMRVLMDGKRLGLSPLKATDLEPGAHKVQVIGARTLEREVRLVAGETASVIFSGSPSPAAPVAAGPTAGWLSVSSPVLLQIMEGSEILGTTQSARIMLPVGRHELLLTNESLGISERRTVQITPGTNANVHVTVPTAPLNINALPWAEVWVDGRRVGETPIGRYPVPVGTHEVVFRHPEFGERRQIVTVSLKGPARVSVDMRKPQ